MGELTQDRVARYLDLIQAPETLEVIGQRLADGETLMEVCRAWDVPYGRVMTWLMADGPRFEIYKRALEVAAHKHVSETVEIAEGVTRPVLDEKGKPVLDEFQRPILMQPDVVRDKLRVETRFRVAKYHAPSVYGEKMEVKHSGTITFSNALRSIAERRRSPRAVQTIDVTPVSDETVL